MDLFSEFIIKISVLVFSIVLHEVSHGAVAGMFGDPTAKQLGRLTLNPLKHLDPVGSVLVPVFTSLLGFPFGWAKPVPYNPMNLRNRRVSEALVGLAGPATNFLIAITFGLILRFVEINNPGIFLMFSFTVFINLLLGIFNLVPIPPLDGSKLLYSIFSISYKTRIFLERNGFIILILFIFFGFQIIIPIISAAFSLITGIPTGGLI